MACGLSLCLLAGCGPNGTRQTTTIAATEPAPSASPLPDIPTFSEPIAELTLGQVADELVAMGNFERMVSTLDTETAEAARAAIREADRVHTARLHEIVDAIGWPVPQLVGAPAAAGALAVVQHAGHDLSFQEHCLELMHEQARLGRLDAAHVALLTDRVRLYRGEPQVFGTQMTFQTDAHGIAHAVPLIVVEDPARLDERRANFGLPPHAHFVRVLENTYADQRPSEATASVSADAWTE